MGELAKLAQLFLLTNVLEHIEHDRAMFGELVAAANPGCYFLVTVPADPSLWSQHDESFGHWRRYDVAPLAEVWAGLPVTPLLVSYFNSRLLPIVRLVRARSRRRGHAAGRVGTDFWLPNPIANAVLTKLFAGEGRRLVASLKQGSAAGSGVPAGKLSPALTGGAQALWLCFGGNRQAARCVAKCPGRDRHSERSEESRACRDFGKILRCAQNDESDSLAMNSCHSLCEGRLSGIG